MKGNAFIYIMNNYFVSLFSLFRSVDKQELKEGNFDFRKTEMNNIQLDFFEILEEVMGFYF